MARSRKIFRHAIACTCSAISSTLRTGRNSFMRGGKLDSRQKDGFMTGSVRMEGQKGDNPLGQQAESLAEKMQEVRGEISKAIVGQGEVVDGVLIALLAGGHVLLEGAPGLGKTMLVRTLAQAVAQKYSRIQFTPDLLPEDGDGRKSLGFPPGPIFTNLLLADEINRATPKTQSALLEAMQEKQVTVAHTSHQLEEPFFVMATQNPLDR